MKTDLTRIRELEAELRPLREANWLCAIEEALQVLHERGFRAAALGVSHDGTPRLRDGAIDFFIERLSPEQAPTVKRILDPIEGAHGGGFHCDSQIRVTKEVDGQAFAGVHSEWVAARNMVAVVNGSEVQDIDLGQLNASLLRMATGVRREGPHNFSEEELTAVLEHPDILVKAIEVMGGRLAALEWMNRAAVGLDRERSAALIRTIHGAQVVEDFLKRLHHGVCT